ncbi:MAG: metallophosphoesterase family protein [bacterium]
MTAPARPKTSRKNPYASSFPPRIETRALTLPETGGLIAVVSDTHSQPHPDAIPRLTALAPHAILHGGDIGDLTVLDRLAEVAPVIAVRGNIDGHKAAPPDVVDLTITRAETRLRVLLTHIAVRGPKLRADTRRLAATHHAELVVCGHSHVPLIARDGGVVLFNPGSIGPRRFGLPITFGLLEVTPAGVSLRHIDCETGRPWTPPPR